MERAKKHRKTTIGPGYLAKSDGLPAWMLAASTMGFFLFTWLGLYYFTGYLFLFQEKSALFQTTGDYCFSQISRPGGLL